MSYRLRFLVLVVPVHPPEGNVQKAVGPQEQRTRYGSRLWHSIGS